MLSFLWSFGPYLLGIAALLVAMYTLPILQPVLKWFGDNTPKLLDVLKEGLADIMDTAATLLTVSVIAAGAYLIGNHQGKIEGAKVQMEEIRKDYKLLRRK